MRRLAMLPLIALSAPAFAADQPEPPAASVPGEDISSEPSDASEIVVVATRLIGSVDAPQPPLVTLDEEDIATYGASSLTELITALGPQTSSSRGRGGGFPVILLNGQRISSFREMRNIPPEAIRRMEVLPEEVALRFGYQPNQRVVNFILKDNYSSRTVEVEYHVPTAGGFSTWDFEASLLNISGPRRLNLTVSADDTSPLTEAERGIAVATPLAAGAIDPRDYRTLVSDSRNLGINGTWSTALSSQPNSGSLTLNAAASRADSLSFSGIGALSADGTQVFPLYRRSKTESLEAGATLSKPIGDWRLTATADASRSTTLTTRAVRPAAGATGPLGEDLARARNDSATGLVTMIGRPLSLPAGDVSTTFKLGYAYTGITSSDTRSNLGETRLTRGDLNAGVNVGVPIASRRENVLAGIGDLNLNFSAGLNHLSDFGTLYDYSAGLTWAPTEKLNFQASYIVNEAAPSLGNLGNPQIITDNVLVYDFATGQNALVTLISGGNPNLRKEQQRDLKLSANWQLPFVANSNFLVEYFRNNSDDVTASFPLLTPAIEAAFPGRVTRDGAGNLVSIDQRPVTFDSTRSSRLRYGFNVSGRIGRAPPGREGGMGGGRRGGGGMRGMGMGGGGEGAPGASGGGGGGFGRMMGGGRGGGGQGRWNLSVFHTIRFDETVTIAPGGPVLDLLSGDALTGGGVSRHSLEVEGGAFYKGFGLRFNGNWAAPTRVRASGLPGASDLRFGSKFDLDLRAFVNFDQQAKLIKSVPFLKGSRLTLEVENLFDSRQRVTDATGVVPLSYQPDLIDPRGRVIGIEFRKQF